MVSIDGLGGLWDKLFSAQPDPPPLLVLLTAVVALAVVATRLPWRIARNQPNRSGNDETGFQVRSKSHSPSCSRCRLRT